MAIPTYIFTDRQGTYYFQKRVPTISKVAKEFIRLSLTTKNRDEALSIARELAKVFDELPKNHFQTKSGITKTIEILKKHKESNSLNNHINQSTYYQRLEAKFVEEIRLLREEIRNQGRANLFSIKISEAMNLFIDERKLNWKHNSDSELTYRKEVLTILLELFGDIPTSILTKQHAIQYKTVILNYPKNRRKNPKFRKLSIDQILKLQIDQTEKLHDRTKSSYLQKLSSFFDWLDKHDFAIPHLNEPLKGIIKIKSRSFDDRSVFTSQDLTKLFNSKFYVDLKHDKSFKYWVPLIGLLTGARQGEICQLFVSDIYQEPKTNIWVFDINENDHINTKKSLKRHYHKRLVPIHPELIRLGLIEFCEYRKQCGDKRLFPELIYKTQRNSYGSVFSKWFNETYMNARHCDITTARTSFHSLRHNVINFFSHNLDISENKFAYVVGQSPSGNIASTTYIKPSDLTTYNGWYQKLDFSDCVDFDLIPNWKLFSFNSHTKIKSERLVTGRFAKK